MFLSYHIYKNLKKEFSFLHVSNLGVIKEVNESFLTDTHMEIKDVIGKSLKKFFKQDFLKIFDKNIAVSFQHPIKNWEEKNFEGFYIKNPSLETFIFLKKRDNHEMNEDINEAKLTALDRAMAIIEFDINGYVTSANQNFLNAMGYTLHEVLNKHHKIFCKTEDYQSKEYQRFWDSLKKGHYLSNVFERRKKDQSLICLQATYNRY